ncbi:YggT family protein [Entomospira culicis]|uniref:YggT family protein n=1 Tax=Entomospira culicis TaxID=2719989 RepID=A0A968KW55_9SPIO|nr:YggT family protein [Entomospira culicis]NIZ19664.1 YggT family protein [Entomospira culicis]NIZ69878.1 YggT family protein [Entomospira culicis]WDI36983.1 YggT family protein [Entomospira culicis]WDI38612.1 YggT family protein [Entomospira culicis]
MDQQFFFFMLERVFRVYYYVLLSTVIISWIPSLRHSAIGGVLYALTEPYVRLFRGRFSRIGMLDISFLWAILFWSLLLRIISIAQAGRTVSIFTVLAMFIIMVFQVIQSLLLILLILTIVRLIFYKTQSPQGRHAGTMMDMVLNPMVQSIKALVSKKRFISHQRLLVYLLLALAVGYYLWSFWVGTLLNLLLQTLA